RAPVGRAAPTTRGDILVVSHVCIFYYIVPVKRILRLSAFFFNDPATTEIYTLSLHDALPIWIGGGNDLRVAAHLGDPKSSGDQRSEEHTSELQSLAYLVCRLLLEKKKESNPQFSSDSRAMLTFLILLFQ